MAPCFAWTSPQSLFGYHAVQSILLIFRRSHYAWILETRNTESTLLNFQHSSELWEFINVKMEASIVEGAME